MTKLIWFVLIVCVHQSWSQEASSTEASKDGSDPVSLLLSNLRNLVENSGAPFDDGFDFIPMETRRKEPMYGKPRQDYFKRIKENYGKFQKSIGSVLGDLSLPKKLFGGDLKNKDGSTVVDVKVPIFPVHVKVKTSKTESPKEPVTQVPGFMDVFQKPKDDSVVEKSTKVGVKIPSLPLEVKVKSKVESVEDGSKSPEEPRKLRPQLSKVSTKVKVGDLVKVKVQSEAKVVKRIGQSPSSWIELGEPSGTGRGKRDTTKTKYATEEQKEVFSKTFYDFVANPTTDDDDLGDIEVDIIDDPSGRFLGEVLYSEEAFDNMTKEAIKNAKWALDSDLAPSKILDKLDAVAKLILSRPKPFTKSKRTPEDVQLKAKRDESRLPKISLIQPDLSRAELREVEVIEPPRETVLIGLTENGVPVQMRFGPEMENPYRILHQLLSNAQVVMRVALKTVLLDGEIETESEADLPPPVLHVDMSNEDQRNSFLRTLRKFKSDSEA